VKALRDAHTRIRVRDANFGSTTFQIVLSHASEISYNPFLQYPPTRPIHITSKSLKIDYASFDWSTDQISWGSRSRDRGPGAHRLTKIRSAPVCVGTPRGKRPFCIVQNHHFCTTIRGKNGRIRSYIYIRRPYPFIPQ